MTNGRSTARSRRQFATREISGRALQRAQQQAFAEISAQEQEAQQRLKEVGSELVERRRAIESQRAQLSSQSFLRSLGIAGASQRARAIQELGQRETNVQQGLAEIQKRQQQVSSQAELQRQQVVSQIEKLKGTRQIVEVRPSRIVTQTVPAQQLDTRQSTAFVGEFQGPVRPGTSEEEFRRTGESVPVERIRVATAGEPRGRIEQFVSEVETEKIRGRSTLPREALAIAGAGALTVGRGVTGAVRGIGELAGGVSERVVGARRPSQIILDDPLESAREEITPEERERFQLSQQQIISDIGGRIQTQPLATTGAVLGEAALIGGPTVVLRGARAVETAARLPRTSTGFVTKGLSIEEGRAIVRTAFTTEQRGLLSTRRFLGGAEAEVSLIGRQGDDLLFAVGTRGAQREVVRVLPGGKVRRLAPQGFGVAETVQVRQQQAGILVSKGEGITGTFGGTRQPFLSASATVPITRDISLGIGRAQRIERVPGGFKRVGQPLTQAGIIKQAQKADEFVTPREITLTGQEVSQAQRQALQSFAEQQARQQAQLGSEALLAERRLIEQTRNLQAARVSGGLGGGSIFFQAVEQPQPRLVGGTVTTESTFAGQAEFERTGQFAGPPQIQGPQDFSLLNFVQPFAEGLSQEQRQNISLASRRILRNLQQQRQLQISSAGFAQPQIRSSGQVLRSIQLNLVRQAQQQRLLQRLANQQRLQRTAITTTTTPPIVPGGLPLKNGGVSALKSALSKVQTGSFDVIAGIPGRSKVKVVAERLQPFRALKRGLDFISGDISASFKLRRNPNPPRRQRDIAPPQVSKEFRTSKNDLFRIVERREFRLNTGVEKSQIKRARKK